MRRALVLAAIAAVGVGASWALAAKKAGKAAPPDPRPLKQLMAKFSSDNPGTRIDAADAVATKGKQAVGPLIAALKSKDWKVRRAASDALGMIGPDAAAAVPELMKLLSDKDGWVREGAAGALGKMGDAAKPALSLLVKAAGEKDEFIRETAMTALDAIFKNPTAAEKAQLLKAACAAIEHPDTGFSVRRFAFPVLQKYGQNNADAKRAMLYMLTHPAQGMWGDVQYKAAEALLAEGEGAEAVEPLTDLLYSDSKTDRGNAANTLAKFGSLAKPALAKLERLAKSDPVDGVRAAAAAAVEQIKSGAAPEAGKAKSKRRKGKK